MTPDQYRREGAEAMRASCVHAVNATASPIVGTPYSAGGRAFSDAIRAIDVDEVLARLPPATDAVARLWHAARLGLDMARANDLTNTAETIMEAMNAVECPCKGSDEMCPCQNRRPAPDAVARPCAGCGKPSTGMCWTDCGMSLCGAPICANCSHVDEKYGWRHEPRAAFAACKEARDD